MSDKKNEQPADTTGSKSPGATSFADHAESEAPSILREFWDFLRFNKKWWLAPIVVVLCLMAALIFLSGSAGAPFIYTLF